MRIIAGALKSRKISFPKTRLTRPMTDRSKETLFNILGGLVNSKNVLDLYAGSGSLGLEALSRGATFVTFVDRADWATRVIRKNVSDLGLMDKAAIYESDVFRAIDKLEKRGEKFSLIFVDPPFNKGLVKKTLIKIGQSGIVTPFAQIVVGHSSQEELPSEVPSLSLTRSKRIGQAFLSFYFKVESKNGEAQSYLSGEF